MTTLVTQRVRFPDTVVWAEGEELFDVADAQLENITLYDAEEEITNEPEIIEEEIPSEVTPSDEVPVEEFIPWSEELPSEPIDDEPIPDTLELTDPEVITEEQAWTIDEIGVDDSTQDNELPIVEEEVVDEHDSPWSSNSPTVEKVQTATLYEPVEWEAINDPSAEAYLETAFNIISQEITVTMPVDLEIQTAGGEIITKETLELVPDLWPAEVVQEQLLSAQWNAGEMAEQEIEPDIEEDALFGASAIDEYIAEAETPPDELQPAQKYEKWSPRSTSFEFGLSGEHLLFSDPVMIEYAMPFPDGTKVEVSAYHVGDNAVGDEWVSTQAGADCAEGDTTLPGNVAVVMWGRARFYTCGASTFFFTYTGGANTGNFVDNGTLPKTVTITTWDVGTWFTIQKLIVILDFQPIDSENPLVYWTTNAYSSEKSFTITSPGGTTRTLVAAGGYTNDGPAVKVRAIFDDQATGGIGALPATGTFLPNQTLSVYSGVNPIGTWTLTMWDNAAQDGVILWWFQLQMANVWCGDGTTLSGEACDDGNNTNGDGCSLSCTIEPGYTCTRASPSICTATPSATWLRVHYDGSMSWTRFLDISWSGHHATGFNGVFTGTLNGETIICFDGVNDYVQLTTWLSLSYPFTTSTWVRTSSIAINGGILSLAQSTATNVMYNIEHNNATPRVKTQNTVARLANGTSAMTTTWRFLITAVYNTNTDRDIYVNGIYEWQNTNNVAYNAAVNRLELGRFADSTPSNYFTWCIDDVRVYKNALSSGQIYDLYARPATMTTSTVTSSSPELTGTMLGPLDRIRLTISGTNYTWANLGNGTWMLTGGQITPALSSGTYTVTMLVTNPYNRAVTYTGYFIYSPPTSTGSVSISSTGNIAFPDMTVENYFQTGNVNSSDYLTVTDTLWSTSGYYTTLQITQLSWIYTTIPTSRIARQATGVVLISGSANPYVTLWSAFTSFSYATGTATFLKRDLWTGAGIYGTYGTILQLRVDIPAYSTPDIYSGTLTYTLFEN